MLFARWTIARSIGQLLMAKSTVDVTIFAIVSRWQINGMCRLIGHECSSNWLTFQLMMMTMSMSRFCITRQIVRIVEFICPPRLLTVDANDEINLENDQPNAIHDFFLQIFLFVDNLDIFFLLFSNGFAVIVIHFTKHSSLHNCTNTFSPSNFDDDFVLFISLWTLVVGCIYTIVIITLWIISLTLDTDRNHFHTKQNPFYLRLQIDAIIVSAIKTQMKICRRQSEKNKNVHVNLESIDAYGCLC